MTEALFLFNMVVLRLFQSNKKRRLAAVIKIMREDTFVCCKPTAVGQVRKCAIVGA